MYYVYVLNRGDKDGTYIGYTENLVRRLKEHKSKKPELVYFEAFRDERDARLREKMLKERGQAVRRLRERLKYSL